LRGASEKLGSLQELDRFLREGLPLDKLPGPRIELDLTNGMKAAQRRIDQIRPIAITVKYGALEVARINPVPGAERIRSRHFKSLLLQILGLSPFRWLLSAGLSRSPEESPEIDAVVSGGIDQQK
jgi:hypothetical protein